MEQLLSNLRNKRKTGLVGTQTQYLMFIFYHTSNRNQDIFQVLGFKPSILAT